MLGLMTTGFATTSAMASCVFRPLPVMQRTIDLVAVDPALLDQLLGDGERHAAGGLGPDALGLGQQPHGVDDRVVVDVLAPAAGLADQLATAK